MFPFIIATYNRAEMVARCVKSVLASDYEPLEVIVVNDHSPDTTAEVLAAQFGTDPRVKIITNEVNLQVAAPTSPAPTSKAPWQGYSASFALGEL